MTATPTTADIEQKIAAIDQRHAAVAAERAAIAQQVANTSTTSASTSARLEALGREAAQLMHHDRVKAQQELARLRDRERDQAALRASLAVAGEHRQLCGQIAALAGELAHVLQGETEIHRQLVVRAGRSRLPDLVYNDAQFIERIERLAEIAAINARARRAGGQEQAAEVVL